jgi:hypothetical protein
MSYLKFTHQYLTETSLPLCINKMLHDESAPLCKDAARFLLDLFTLWQKMQVPH